MSKRKLNVIDYVIIILVIAVIGIGAFVLNTMINQHSGSNEGATVTFEVFLQEQNPYLGEAIRNSIGKELLLSQKEKDYGVLKDVRIEPAKRTVQDRVKGVFATELVPNKEDITLIIEAKASVTDAAIKIGQTQIQTGTMLVVGDKDFAAAGYIFNIDVN